MKQKNILDSRDRLAQRLPDPTQIARATLLRRTIRHAQGGSKCRAGGGHPVWVLTVTYPGGRTRQFSIRREQRAQVQQWVRIYFFSSRRRHTRLQGDWSSDVCSSD